MDKYQAFKLACENYLRGVSLTALRAYGRFLGVRKPTAMKKFDLISEIICLLCGEKLPQRNGLGAPVKDNYVEPALLHHMDELRAEYGVMDALKKQNNEQPVEKKSVPVEVKTAEENKINVLQFNFVYGEMTAEQKQKLSELLNSLQKGSF